VDEEDLLFLEKALNVIIPDGLKTLYRKPPDLNFFERMPSFLWPVHHDGVGILEINTLLRTRDFDPYPSTMLAFATNECGDYWVVNSTDGSINYIDPDESVEVNLSNKELWFPSFDEWMQYKINKL
jgi:hypothetical protein